MKRRQKYNAKPTTVHGIRFASQKEALYYVTLKQLERAKQIRAVELQPRFALDTFNPAGERITVAHYVADFIYYDIKKRKDIVADVKGMDTPMSKLKRKWLKLQSGIDVVLV